MSTIHQRKQITIFEFLIMGLLDYQGKRSGIEHILFVVFALEGVLNTISGVTLYFFPEFCLKTLDLDISPLVIDLTRWFGAMVFILAYIGLRAKVDLHVIEALLLGDILYIFIAVHTFNISGRPWTFSAHFSVWCLIPLMTARFGFILSRRFSPEPVVGKVEVTVEKDTSTSPRRGRSRSRSRKKTN